MNNNNDTRSGSGILLLFLLFLGLKLGHVIDWSWWWVTAPLWGSIALAVVLFLAGAVLALLDA
jgi:hypothetical protein